MAATTKAALLGVTQKEFSKLMKLCAALDGEAAMRKREDDTSIKDVIAHRAHWIDLFLGWYRDGQAGKAVQFPAPGYKWNELKRYNADLRRHQKDLGWDEAIALLEDRADALCTLITGLDGAALYGGPMKGGRNNWTTGRWAEAAGPSHYRSAAKYLRACLRADKDARVG